MIFTLTVKCVFGAYLKDECIRVIENKGICPVLAFVLWH